MVTVNSKDLDRIIKQLDKLHPESDSKFKGALRTGLRKAAKPLRSELRNQIQTGLSSTGEDKKKLTGRLKRSIGIISGRIKKGINPTIYVGPRVKKSFKGKEKSGFYFYFLEYGKVGLSPRRMLEKTVSKVGTQVLNGALKNIGEVIEKRFNKKFG